MSKSNPVEQVCRELGITQKELSNIIKVDETTISRWVNKGNYPGWTEKMFELLILEKRFNQAKGSIDTLLTIFK